MKKFLFGVIVFMEMAETFGLKTAEWIMLAAILPMILVRFLYLRRLQRNADQEKAAQKRIVVGNVFELVLTTNENIVFKMSTLTGKVILVHAPRLYCWRFLKLGKSIVVIYYTNFHVDESGYSFEISRNQILKIHDIAVVSLPSKDSGSRNTKEHEGLKVSEVADTRNRGVGFIFLSAA